MASLVKRTTGNADESTIILKAAAASAFGDIGANAICCSNHLLSDCVLRKLTPLTHHLPELVG